VRTLRFVIPAKQEKLRRVRLTVAVLIAAVNVALGADEKLVNAATIMATVDIFHEALADGDAGMMLALLVPDALIIENGSVQSRVEYAGKHLQAHIAFARATSSRWLVANLRQERNAAWVRSNAKVTGSLRGKPVNDSIAELMVLRKTPKGWHIRAIHWSH
jgi:ketosteroid isomerase-like protein